MIVSNMVLISQVNGTNPVPVIVKDKWSRLNLVSMGSNGENKK